MIAYSFGDANTATRGAFCRSLPDLVNQFAREIESKLPPREIGSSSDKIGLQRQFDRLSTLLQNQVGQRAQHVIELPFEGGHANLDSSLCVWYLSFS